MEFNQYLLGEFKVDMEFELYVTAWMAYHEATNKVDGQYKINPPEITKLAVSAGKHAMNRILPEGSRPSFLSQDEKWRSAKLEALRRLEKL